jgi:hypothetical protein
MISFENALSKLLKQASEENWSWEQLQTAVTSLHREYDREVPPPITGTMATVDPEDKFSGG